VQLSVSWPIKIAIASALVVVARKNWHAYSETAKQMLWFNFILGSFVSLVSNSTIQYPKTKENKIWNKDFADFAEALYGVPFGAVKSHFAEKVVPTLHQL